MFCSGVSPLQCSVATIAMLIGGTLYMAKTKYMFRPACAAAALPLPQRAATTRTRRTHGLAGQYLVLVSSMPVNIKAFFGSIPEDFGNRGESTITKLPTWEINNGNVTIRKTKPRRIERRCFVFLPRRNHGMASGTFLSLCFKSKFPW